MSEPSKTAVVEARVDIRDLATCASFLIRGGIKINSRSDLIWRIVRSMAATLEESREQTFASTEEAMGYMAVLNLGSWNRLGPGGRPMNGANLSKVVEKERLEEFTKGSISNSTTVEDLVQIAQGLLEKRGK